MNYSIVAVGFVAFSLYGNGLRVKNIFVNSMNDKYVMILL